MSALAALADRIPEPARDIRVNLSSVFQGGPLSDAQRWGVAVATAIAARNHELRDAALADARAALGEAAGPVIEDAMAAAALMGMNNVYYRFRHFVGKESYSQKPARLRMQRIVKPAGSRVDFELICLAVSAVNGCESCIRSHEKVVLEGGQHGEPLTEEHVHDAARIAAVMHAAAVALELGA